MAWSNLKLAGVVGCNATAEKESVQSKWSPKIRGPHGQFIIVLFCYILWSVAKNTTSLVRTHARIFLQFQLNQ
uniref:Uncharacterized protein n=1 Tax=Romanomermis culicivorax TaxID=13658 RepID=A0A915I470_ROMCU